MSELNNWLQYQEDEEFERFKAEKGSKRQTRVAMLAGLGLAASLGVVATKADEAKADTQGQEVHDLLLCTYTTDNGEAPGTGYIATNPKDSDDPLYPQSFNNVDPEKIPSYNTPLFWKGYIFRATYDYYTGASIYRVYKMVNGQEIETGQLPNIVGSDLFYVISHNAGIIMTGGDFYRLTDTGSTVTAELLGDAPIFPGASYGGYLFGKSLEEIPVKSEKAVLLSEDDPTEIASIATVSSGLFAFHGLGSDVDEQTGEFVITADNGFRVAQLPTLDQDGKLPLDFSLTDVTFGPAISLPEDVITVVSTHGYKYFLNGVAEKIIIASPNGQKYTIDQSQFGTANISWIKKLPSGGIYVIFESSFNQPPISLVPTSDPAKFIAPGVPFEKIIDEPTNVTQHIIDDGCTVIPQEYQGEFEPILTPCEGVTCPPPANECKQASCDSGTGDCEDTPKPDGTACDADANACTVGDACADGQCASGTPKTCAEPAEQCKQSAGCDADTGDCLVINKTNGVLCNDGDPGTENDKCAGGVCEGTPIQVEPNPETEPDVVEQKEEIIEGELIEEGGIEPDEDVVEQDDSSDTADAVDASETEQETGSAEPKADTADQKSDTKVDSSDEDLTVDDVNGETSEDSNGENVEASGETQGEAGTKTEAGPDTPVPQIDEETLGGTPDFSCKVANTQRQQRGVGEMLSVLGLAALGVVGLRRRKEKN